MVYVTHDQTEAMTLGDRLAVMRTGLLQQAGTPQELYDRPLNLFVAGFIGSPAMNFMGGHAGGGHAADQPRRPAGVPAAAPGAGIGQRRAARSSSACAPRTSRTPRSSRPRTSSSGSRSAQTIDVRESMGSDVFVYFNLDSDLSAHSDQLADLAADVGHG